MKSSSKQYPSRDLRWKISKTDLNQNRILPKTCHLQRRMTKLLDTPPALFSPCNHGAFRSRASPPAPWPPWRTPWCPRAPWRGTSRRRTWWCFRLLQPQERTWCTTYTVIAFSTYFSTVNLKGIQLLSTACVYHGRSWVCLEKLQTFNWTSHSFG